MNSAFFSDLLSSIADRGRAVLGREPVVWPKDQAARAASLVDLCRALLGGRGEATGVAIAGEILDRYDTLDAGGKAAFFTALARDFGPDRDRLDKALEAWRKAPDDAAGAAIHYASEPQRQELFRRINRAPGATAALVKMRADLLALVNPSLAAVDRDFQHLFRSWFNRGFLVLRRIDWAAPASVLEKIIRYEAVHEIHDWADLRRRIDPPDRRCYAFFHPAMVDEPLIFVEVALTEQIPAAVAPLLAQDRTPVTPQKARVATFYSISNCQQGLAGITFGNFLIKQVVEEIRRELPKIETFVTLSPVPGLRRWAQSADEAAVDAATRDALLTISQDGWPKDAETAERLRKALEQIAAHYFLKERRADGRVVDSVARFHLGNGARLERINLMADLSRKGLSESFGLMVNYLYDLDEIEKNHEAFANQGEIAASAAVKKLAGVNAGGWPRLRLPTPNFG
ncbi:MAG: malonyl-CoA decarboxylase [Hyphomicrobiales bacterium]|nr:malonyl-CoA decarboxylase [Hyphomicrobiales bacterium]